MSLSPPRQNMMAQSSITKFIGLYVLPLGFMVFLTFLCLIESRSSYHTLLYLLIALPTLTISLLEPSLILRPLKTAAFRVTLLLCTMAILSTLWNNAEVADWRNIRYIISIILFILSVSYIHQYQQTALERSMLFAAALWALFGLLEIYSVYYQQGLPLSYRAIGAGNLSNTLLTSHVYGAFATFIASHYFYSNKRLRSSLLYLVVFLSLLLFILQTHSRTPLLALSAVFICLLLKYRNKHVIYIVASLTVLSTVYAIFNYELLIQRGLSYRPEIWLAAFDDIRIAPLLGHGIGSKMSLFISSLNKSFSDSHNIHIGLTYQLGVIGLIVWLTLIAHLFRLYLKNTHNLLIATAFPMLIYGIIAGMTEGGNFFGRPKEVWFLTWLPIAILIASESTINKPKAQ